MDMLGRAVEARRPLQAWQGLKELINREPSQPTTVRVTASNRYPGVGGRIFVGRLGRPRVDSLCERRVKALARLLRSVPAQG